MRKTILYSVFFILIIGAIGGFYMYHVLTVESKVINEETFENIKHLSVNTSTIDVEMKASKDSAVHVELIGNKKQKTSPKLVTSTSKDQLNIEVQEVQKSKWMNASFTPNANKLIITVPEQLIQTIKSKSDTGNLMIEGVKVEKFLIQTDVGNIHFKDTTGAYTIESTTGSIKMEVDDILHPLSIASDSGDIQLQTKQKPTDTIIRAKTHSGKVSIYNEQLDSTVFGEGQNKIELYTTSGDISVNTK